MGFRRPGQTSAVCAESGWLAKKPNRVWVPVGVAPYVHVKKQGWLRQKLEPTDSKANNLNTEPNVYSLQAANFFNVPSTSIVNANNLGTGSKQGKNKKYNKCKYTGIYIWTCMYTLKREGVKQLGGQAII